MNMRRFLAAMLAVVMLIAMVPAKAQAAEDDTTYESGKLYLDKTATLEDDGTYTIRMEAFATGTPVTTTTITGKPLDVVLVIDQSGSMYNYQYLDDLEKALDTFIAQLVDNGHTIGMTHRVAVAGFACAAWEMTVTHSIGQLTDPWTGDLPVSNGSYGSLWTNTGIYLNDGTFKNYQQFEFKEVTSTSVEYRKTDMTVSYNSSNTDFRNVADFFTADGEQIQVKVTRSGSSGRYRYTYAFQTDTGKALTDWNVTNSSSNSLTVSKDKGPCIKVVGLPTYSNVDDYYVTLGEYDHPVLTDSQNLPRLFPKYFVDDTETWTYTDENGVEQPQTVRRGIYYLDGKWYYDFRKYDNDNADFPRVPVNGTGVLGADQKVYTIDYDSIYTGSDDLSEMFTGGFLTEEDYQKTFMNVTDGAHGAGNVSKAINSIIDNLGASGATRTDIGMEMAYNILVNNPLTEEDKAEGRERVVIVFTDGVPGQSKFEIDEANKALEYGAMIKDLTGTEDNVDIYTIGLHGATIDTDDVQDSNVVEPYDQTAQFMNGLSSNYPDADNMEDVWGTITKQTYTDAGSISLSNYRSNRNTWQTISDCYVLVNGVYEPIEVYVTAESYTIFGSTVYFNHKYQFRSKTTQTTLNASTSNNDGSRASATIQNAYKLTTTTSEGYLPSGTPAVDGGKFYKEANNTADLEHMFPTIVTESTSTSMDSVYLTDGSILRDIMSDALRMTGPVSIWTATQTGTWTSTNEEQTQGKIAWGAETLTGDRRDIPNPSQMKGEENFEKVDGEEEPQPKKIQLYNTNPAADGNFYQTATGVPNLTAPPTVDITGFDYQKEFVAFNKTGKKLIVYIRGIEAQADAVRYGQMNMTNHVQSGLWSPMQEDGTRKLVGTLPLPKTTFTEALYVLDYAKPMTLNPADLKMSVVKSLDVDGMNGFNPAVTSITEGNGIVTVKNGKYVYTPTTTAWNGYDTFYVFGDTADAGVLGYSANDVYDNLWSRVKVLPANNVYYEDTFIETVNGEAVENGVSVGIEYSGTWSTVDDTEKTEKEPNQNEENPESGEFNNGEDKPFGGVHGWEDYLVDDTGFSDGSAHKTELTDTNKTATATFTFTGTGVDIYSYTDLVQGAIMANIYRGDHVPTTAEMLADSSLRPLYSVIMDNFSISGGYYQIPTLSLHEKNVNKTDAEGNIVTVQEPLEHGTYTVKLTVVAKTDDADDDGVKTRRYTYHLDGIRIYNPIQNLEGDETVKKAYGEEELNASFVEVRDILLDKTNIDANGGTLGGVVFLDQKPNGNNKPDLGENGAVGVENEEIGLYECYGPKNEVYLGSYQSIAFVPKAGMHYYVGLKSPTGKKVCVSILKDGNDQLLEIDHTTDLYYEVTPYDDGVVVIQNAGMDEEYNEFDNLLSVTKIKVTGPNGAPVEPADFFEPVDQPTMLRMVRTLREEAAVEPEIPEENEPTEPTGPEVDIENPTEPSEPEAPGEDDKNDYDYLWKLIGGIFDLIRGIIFG